MRKLLEELFRRFYQDIYRYFYRMSGDASLSEDLAAEVFLEAVKSIATFRGESDVRTWLYAIARHRWLGYLRKKKQTLTAELLTEMHPDGKPLPEQQYEDKLILQRICEILQEEPVRSQKIMRMRAEGYSFREIGCRLNISENSARVIEFRTRKKIQEILRREDLVDE